MFRYSTELQMTWPVTDPAKLDADHAIGEGLAHTTGSSLRLRLTVDGAVVSGTWTERTALKGYYHGATYHGTLQLLIDPIGRRMTGKWVGFGKKFKINTGEWDLAWVEGSTSKTAQREYHLKV